MTQVHSYGGYANGCRCPTCRGAKAGYMRDRRAAAGESANAFKAQTGDDQILLWISHGKVGYQEYGCRCTDCRGAMAEESRRLRADRRDREVVASS